MSECCYMALKCLRKDVPFFKEIGFDFEFQDEQPEKPYAELVDERANYAHNSVLEALAGRGMPFLAVYGGVPGAFDPGRYACDGELVIDQLCTEEGDPVVRVDNDGNPLANEISGVKRYIEVRRKAEELLGIRK